MKVSQNEEDGNIDILSKEIELWKDFRHALREKIHFSSIRCSRNVDTIKTTSELLAPKVSIIQQNH
ncbi:MAG TPA: hypothetical protein VH500_08240 [Nitrososphaeraceae archaeon]